MVVPDGGKHWLADKQWQETSLQREPNPLYQNQKLKGIDPEAYKNRSSGTSFVLCAVKVNLDCKWETDQIYMEVAGRGEEAEKPV